MDRKQKTTLAMAMVSSAGLAVPSQAFMQESVLVSDTSAVADVPVEVVSQASDPEKLIEFNFTEAPYSAVLEFFSRESGIPMIREAEPPEGTMTFISGGNAYTFDEALDILNKFLRAKKVYVTRENNYLYFRTLKDQARQGPDPVGQDRLNNVPDSPNGGSGLGGSPCDGTGSGTCSTTTTGSSGAGSRNTFFATIPAHANSVPGANATLGRCSVGSSPGKKTVHTPTRNSNESPPRIGLIEIESTRCAQRCACIVAIVRNT